LSILSLVSALCLGLTPDAGLLTDAGTLELPILKRASPAQFPADAPTDAGVIEVRLKLTISVEGSVEDVRIAELAPEPFATEALRAARSLEFAPAQLEHQPIAVELEYLYRFEPPVPEPEAAPHGELSGQICARGNRRPIPFAALIADDATTTQTDRDGRFHLRLSPGSRRLTLRAAGFRTETFDETVVAGSALEVRYALSPEHLNPFETVVRAERSRTELRRVALNESAELREIPGTGGDPFRVLTVLPGVALVGSGLPYPIVRGASPSASAFFIEDIRVPQLVHDYLGPAVVNSGLIEGIDFYAGGAPVQYGRLLAGAMQGHLTRPPEEFHASASVDLLSAGGLVEVPLPQTGTAITLAGRCSYSGLLLGLVSDVLSPGQRIVADFWDYQGRVEQKLFGGTLRLLAFGSSDAFGKRSEDPNKNSAGLQSVIFHRVDLLYQHPLGPGVGELGLTAGNDQFNYLNQARLNVGVGILRQETLIDQLTLGARLKWSAPLSESWRVSTGLTFDHIIANWSQDFSVVIPGAPVGGGVFEQPTQTGFWLGG
jgi:hypothetical protein